MRWLVAAWACILAFQGVRAAKQIVGNVYQYPLPGGGATTFIKGPAYESRIESVLAGDVRGLSGLLSSNGAKSTFHYAPHGTSSARNLASSVHAQAPKAVILVPRATARVGHGVVQPHPLVYRLVNQPGPTITVNGVTTSNIQGPTTAIRQTPSAVNVDIPTRVNVQNVRHLPQTSAVITGLGAPVSHLTVASPDILTVMGPRLSGILTPSFSVRIPIHLALPRITTHVLAPALTTTKVGAVSRITVNAPQQLASQVRAPFAIPTATRTPVTASVITSKLAGDSPMTSYNPPSVSLKLTAPSAFTTFAAALPSPIIRPATTVTASSIATPVVREIVETSGSSGLLTRINVPAVASHVIARPAQVGIPDSMTVASGVVDAAVTHVPALSQVMTRSHQTMRTVAVSRPFVTRLVTPSPVIAGVAAVGPAITGVFTGFPRVADIVAPQPIFRQAVRSQLISSRVVTPSVVGTSSAVQSPIISGVAAPPSTQLVNAGVRVPIITNTAAPIPTATNIAQHVPVINVASSVATKNAASAPIPTITAAPAPVLARTAALAAVAMRFTASAPVVTRIAAPASVTSGSHLAPVVNVVAPTPVGTRVTVRSSVLPRTAAPVNAVTKIALPAPVITGIATSAPDVSVAHPALVTDVAEPAPVAVRIAAPTPVTTKIAAPPVVSAAHVNPVVNAAAPTPLVTRIVAPAPTVSVAHHGVVPQISSPAPVLRLATPSPAVTRTVGFNSAINAVSSASTMGTAAYPPVTMGIPPPVQIVTRVAAPGAIPSDRPVAAVLTGAVPSVASPHQIRLSVPNFPAVTAQSSPAVANIASPIPTIALTARHAPTPTQIVSSGRFAANLVSSYKAVQPLTAIGPAQHTVRVPAAVLTRIAAPVTIPLVTRTAYLRGLPSPGLIHLGSPSVRAPGTRYRVPVTGVSSSVFIKVVSVPISSSIAGVPAAIQVRGPGMPGVAAQYAISIPAPVVARVATAAYPPVITRMSSPAVVTYPGGLSHHTSKIPLFASVAVPTHSMINVHAPAVAALTKINFTSHLAIPGRSISTASPTIVSMPVIKGVNVKASTQVAQVNSAVIMNMIQASVSRGVVGRSACLTNTVISPTTSGVLTSGIGIGSRTVGVVKPGVSLNRVVPSVSTAPSATLYSSPTVGIPGAANQYAAYAYGPVADSFSGVSYPSRMQVPVFGISTVATPVSSQVSTQAAPVTIGTFKHRYSSGLQVSTPGVTTVSVPGLTNIHTSAGSVAIRSFGAQNFSGLQTSASAIGTVTSPQSTLVRTPALAVAIGMLGARYSSGLQRSTPAISPISSVPISYVGRNSLPTVSQVSAFADIPVANRVARPESSFVNISGGTVFSGLQSSMAVQDVTTVNQVYNPGEASLADGIVPATTAIRSGPASVNASALITGSGHAIRVVTAPIPGRLTASAQRAKNLSSGQVTLPELIGANAHEIHTAAEGNKIQMEEFKPRDQLIRIHDPPQSASEVIKVDSPRPRQSIVRMVSKSGGPAHVKRVVHEGGTEVFDVQKPDLATERIIQIERGSSAPPHVEVSRESSANPVAAASPVTPVIAHTDAPPALTTVLAAPVVPLTRTIASQSVTSAIVAAVPVGVVTQAAPAAPMVAAPATPVVAAPAAPVVAAPATPVVAAPAAPVVAAPGRRTRRPFTRGNAAWASPLALVATAGIGTDTTSASASIPNPKKVVVRRIVPPGAYGRRLRTKKAGKKATSPSSSSKDDKTANLGGQIRP